MTDKNNEKGVGGELGALYDLTSKDMLQIFWSLDGLSEGMICRKDGRMECNHVICVS